MIRWWALLCAFSIEKTDLKDFQHLMYIISAKGGLHSRLLWTFSKQFTKMWIKSNNSVNIINIIFLAHINCFASLELSSGATGINAILLIYVLSWVQLIQLKLFFNVLQKKKEFVYVLDCLRFFIFGELPL